MFGGPTPGVCCARVCGHHEPTQPLLAVAQAATARDALGVVFALDRRHDNPDRDGARNTAKLPFVWSLCTYCNA